MMSQITEYFKQAELSLAAYADLNVGVDYIGSLKQAGMTASVGCAK
jgi:hypothetical protein